MRKKVRRLLSDRLVFVATIIALLALTLDYGFSVNYWMHLFTDIVYISFASIYFIHFFQQFFFKKKTVFPLGFYFMSSLATLLLILAFVNIANFILNDSPALNSFTAVLVFILVLFDLSARLYNFDQQTLHPALVFVLSFIVLISIGTLLLLAPNASTGSIAFIDALFTATSAVCVTGLAVLDTGAEFTNVGQLVILCLIQLGALGMLSFTSLFALFFKGAGSFGNRLAIKDMINADTLEGTFKHLIQIIIFVFLVEALGALFIFYSIEIDTLAMNERIFFSIFHSVSAFCNAGFSTLSSSLYGEGFRFNYSLHLVIASLIIFGGLGYGVVLNIYQYFKNWLILIFEKLFNFSLLTQRKGIKPRLALNSRIVLYTSASLIIFGAVVFFILEKDNSLSEHSGIGPYITALFSSITTRTAGFNTVDTGALHNSTIFFIFFLMWVGASPGSTGGGIKTTTLAVAGLNIYQQVFGKKNITVSYRRVSQKVLQKSTAIISLSLLMVGLSTFFLICFDESLGVLELLFESISAFSTVGLSMGITANLSSSSKVVIVLTMFLGRVGLLTLLTGLVRQLYSEEYSPIEYPEEEILIN